MDSLQILSCFQREADGRWVCRHAVTVETAHGPVAVEPGMTFRYGERIDDVDLAELLERLGAEHGS